VQLEIKVDYGSTLRYLTALPQRVDRALVLGLDDGAKLVRREMRVYPAKRPNSSYIRRHNLQNSWFTEKPKREGGGFAVRIYSSGNTAPYNIYVQKAGMQATIHRGRWPTEVQVAERLRPQIVNMIQARVNQALSR
jgi:hypothetical protein